MKNFIITLCVISMLTIFGLVNIQAEQFSTEQAIIVQNGDTEFKVSFMYESKNLETEYMPNSTPTEEMLSRMGQRIQRFLKAEDKTNLAKLRKALEGKTVTINVP